MRTHTAVPHGVNITPQWPRTRTRIARTGTKKNRDKKSQTTKKENKDKKTKKEQGQEKLKKKIFKKRSIYIHTHSSESLI